MHKWEKKIALMFNGRKSKLLDRFSGVVSSIVFLVIFWLGVGIFVIRQDIFEGVFIAAGLILVFALHFLISEGVIKKGGSLLHWQRVRPYKAYPEEFRGIGYRFSDSSFPSSHMASMVGGLYVLTVYYPEFLIWAIAFTLLLGWSRLRNGMHYPSDILAGILLGLVYGWITIRILYWIFF